jgi:hypothetical protein
MTASHALRGVDLESAVRSDQRVVSIEERAQRIADLVRAQTSRRWVGVYRISSGEVVGGRGVRVPLRNDAGVRRHRRYVDRRAILLGPIAVL